MKSKTDKLTVTNNRGVAMVSVMIIATVCFLVATIVLEITYTSLLSRKVYRTSNDTMYSAEAAVDDMETVLQSIAVYSIKENKTDPSRHFVDVVEETLKKASGATALTDTATVSDYIYNNLDPYYKKMFSKDGTWDEETKNGEREDNKFKVTVINKSNGDENGAAASMALHVDFTFEDEKGYQSNIETDLVVNDVTQRKSAKDYSLGSYSMFTGGGMKLITNETDNTNAVTNDDLYIYRQEGNAYVGTMSSEAPLAMEIGTGIIMDFAGDFVEINGDLKLNPHSAIWFSSESAQVNIKGTVYIDKNSCFVISEGTNLLCKDIVIVNGEEQWSIFDEGKPSYANCNTSANYTGFFPYNTSSKDSVENNLSSVAYEQDFKSGATGGCVILKVSDEKSYVLECDGVRKDSAGNVLGYTWKTTEGSVVNFEDTKINRDFLYMPEAKTTVWTYDNEALITDPEFARVVNIPVAYLQYQANNKMVDPSNMYYIDLPDDVSDVISKDNEYPGLKGAPAKGISKVGGLTTTEIKGSGEGQSGFKVFANTESGGGYKLSKAFKLNGILYQNVYFKFALDNDGEVLHGKNSGLIMGCSWDKVRVQLNGGQFVGCILSGQYCQYEIHQKDVLACGYSILNAKDRIEEKDEDTAEYLTIEQVMDELEYITAFRVSQNANQLDNLKCLFSTEQEWYDHGYEFCMLDSLIIGGVESFVKEDSGATSGSVTVKDSSMYDFISVENWTQQ